VKDQWDIYEPLGSVPAPGEDLEILAPEKDGSCKMPA
jgi:branched-chain amino acid transport system substrate-binding protein